jgi:short-subunit dehydrogenase
VVSLSETLHHELAERGSRVRVSVLCPGFVKTSLADADRNRPSAASEAPRHPLRENVRRAFESGSPAAQVALCAIEAVREERFYVMTHPEWKRAIRQRFEELLDERNPVRTKG